MSKALVIGAALSGTAVSKLLNKKGYEVFLTDSNLVKNKEELESLGIHVFDGGHPDSLKEQDYELIVKNPGIKYDNPFIKYYTDKGCELLNEIEVASRYVNYKYIAITGTNGKTTTTTLAGEILKKQYGDRAFVSGNIGKPLSDIVLEHENEECYVALEISAFQLLACPKFKPDVACILNLTPDHLDYYSKLEDYYDAKALVLKNMDNNSYYLLNIDDKEVAKRIDANKTNIIKYSLNESLDIRLDNGKVYYKDNYLFDKNDLNIVGEHNLTNAMVAAVSCYLLGVKQEFIQKTIKEFKGIEHRIEFVKEINGVKFYNDSKATNVDSGVVALKSFDKPVVLLAGGHDKHTGFNEIVPYLNKVKKMYVFGETKYQLKDLYKNAILTETMEEAIKKAFAECSNGDIVLLSPFCSSYDQFKNFEERGNIFKKIVNSL